MIVEEALTEDWSFDSGLRNRIRSLWSWCDNSRGCMHILRPSQETGELKGELVVRPISVMDASSTDEVPG